MAKIPTFAVGSIDKVQPAIDSGILKYPSYVWITSGDKENHFFFIDHNLNIREVIGNNPKSVEKVETLPNVADAKEDVLYIYNGLVYVSDGAKLNPMYQDVSSELEQVKADIEALSERINVLEGNPKLILSSKDKFPEVGEENVQYIATDEPNSYIWNAETSAYVPFANSSTIQWIEL